MRKIIVCKRRLRVVKKDSGAVTAEFAIVLPCALVIVLVLLGLGRAVVCAMNCHDAAAQVAYYMVTHHNDKAAASIAQRVAGSGASVKVSKSGNVANIVVKCPLIPDPLHILPPLVESHVSQVLA
ncbi:pilus assembly protein [Bifidobacteriaceae bacterium NR002]|nr:pilus assembly protein [Bifidobacteriaceae bacterium NR002]MDZ7549146.1 pilus assembly protein [Bifidobacteriaceae bacterium NR047]